MPGARASREQAVAQFVLPEVEVLLRVALTLTARPADAEDLVRDTLLRAHRAIDGFDGEQPRAWLLTLMRQAETDRHRHRGFPPPDDPDTGPGRLSAPGTGQRPESLVVGEAFHEVVDAALAALPLKHRQVVRLVDIDGLSYAEAAGLLGVPEGTVTGRLHRARKRIRIQLAAAGLVPRRGGR
ncbi:MAG: sigma-70 family RNA polymerase sigma factor [Streptomyces sp.]|nr:sigma-70 family RNA polymerase sigma factor [Streptomyces sp.]